MMEPEEVNGHLLWFVSERPIEAGKYVCSHCGFSFDRIGAMMDRCPEAERSLRLLRWSLSDATPPQPSTEPAPHPPECR